MATVDQELSAQEKEIVAVGASIGAGCHPCVSHHLRAGAEAGLADDELLAAVTSAERVTAQAAVLLGDHARDTLGPDLTPALLSRLEETLAALGAALGANDKSSIERQLRTALELGATPEQLRQAIATAHFVQENAAGIHLREAERLLDALDAPSSAPAETGCGCGAADAPVDAPREPTTTESVSATTGACGPSQGKATPGGFAAMMAAFCGPSNDPGKVAGPAAAMEKCREMFEHPSTEPTPAASTTAATDTPTPGHGRGKEARR